MKTLMLRHTTAVIARTSAVLVGLLVASALVVSTSPPAQAAYPGKSGRIFFQSDRNGAPHLYSMNSDGSRLAQLTTSSTNISPALSPDGTKLAFIRGGDVWTMDIDGTGLQQVTTTPAAEQTPVWSPDASLIAYVVRADGGSDLEILVRAADGSGLPTQLTDNTFPEYDPAWSAPLPGRPHGLIAFVSARTGDTNRNVYVMDHQGGSVANLTPNGTYGNLPYQGHDDDPSWSPDGRLAYTHTFLPNGGGLPAIWAIEADGSGMARLSQDSTQSASEPAWSPDGQRIAYVGTVGTDRNIAVMAADGSGAGQIDTTTSHDIAPEWQEDSVDPETRITSGPSSGTSTSATVAFTSDEPGSTFECSLDAGAFAACVSPRTWTGLAVRAHQIRVRAVDPVGRPDMTPASASWTVSSPVPPPVTPPAPTPTPPGPTAAASVSSIVRLDSSAGRVPARVSVTPAGSQVRLSVFVRLSQTWVRVGKLRFLADPDGTAEVRVTVRERWRRRLDGQRVKAKLVVAATSPSGVTVEGVERFRLRG